ncbi:MAG TPA: hypothetical protein VGG48_09435 [Rhizomicrobium sp.]|jgi:hypothetical protein
MDLPARLGAAAAFFGIALTMLKQFIGDEVGQMGRRVRFGIFFIGFGLLVSGALVVLLWPSQIPGNGPLVEVSRIEWSIPARDSALEADAYVYNSGDRPAEAPKIYSEVGYSLQPMSKDEENKLFSELRTGLVPPEEADQNEIEPRNSEYWYKLLDDDKRDLKLTKAQISAAAKYAMIIVSYRDGATGGTVLTEYCMYLWRGEGHSCNGHNRIQK